jgi:hypothetical protein
MVRKLYSDEGTGGITRRHSEQGTGIPRAESRLQRAAGSLSAATGEPGCSRTCIKPQLLPRQRAAMRLSESATR